jgi:hypothetical protein
LCFSGLILIKGNCYDLCSITQTSFINCSQDFLYTPDAVCINKKNHSKHKWRRTTGKQRWSNPQNPWHTKILCKERYSARYAIVAEIIAAKSFKGEVIATQPGCHEKLLLGKKVFSYELRAVSYELLVMSCGVGTMNLKP